jgi:hypothetical protein
MIILTYVAVSDKAHPEIVKMVIDSCIEFALNRTIRI